MDARLSEFSRALLKNAHLLPAAMQICRFSDGHLTRRELSRVLGINDNVVDTVLERLRDAELIKEGQRIRGAGGGVDLLQQPSPFWEFAEQMCDRLLGPEWREHDGT